MKKITSVLTASAIIAANMFASCQSNQCGNAKANLKNATDSASYAIGYLEGTNMQEQFSEIDLNNFIAGLNDALKKDTANAKFKDPQTAMMFFRGYMTGKAKKVAEENLAKSNAFLEENKKKEGVITTESGLQYQILQEGTGAQATIDDEVECHYKGTLIDGTVFDSTEQHGGQPAKFPLRGVIQGWQEGIPLMKVGAKYRFFIPPSLGYGENVRPGGVIKPNDALIFDVELLQVIKEEKKDDPAAAQKKK